MHVCIAAYDVANNTGGVNSWVFRFLRELKSQGWQPSVCLYSSCEEFERGTLEQFIIEEGIPYARSRYELETELNVKFTVSSVRSLGADVFVTNCMVPAWYAAPQLERFNIPCVGVNHSDDPFYHALTDHCIAKNGWYQLAGLVAVSKYLETLTNEVASQRTHVARIPE